MFGHAVAGGLAVTAGGTSLCVWDMMTGGRLLQRLSQHQKTVTCVVLSPMAGPDSAAAPRMLSGSLDGHVKVQTAVALVLLFLELSRTWFDAQQLVGLHASASAWSKCGCKECMQGLCLLQQSVMLEMLPLLCQSAAAALHHQVPADMPSQQERSCGLPDTMVASIAQT